MSKKVISTYRIATANNHEGNRRRIPYTGPDCFLTWFPDNPGAKGQGLMMSEKIEGFPGQQWKLMGDCSLYNGVGLYLTACDDKSLKLLERDKENLGQKWIPNWHLHNARFTDQCLNIYGGGNGNFKSVGLYTGTRISSEEWRHGPKHAPLTRPKITHTKFRMGEMKEIDGSSKTEALTSIEATNRGPVPQPAPSLKFSKSKMSETRTSSNFENSFSESIELALKVGGEVTGGSAEEKISIEFSAKEAFGFEDATGKSETEELIVESWTVPPYCRARYTMVARKVRFKVPFTMTFEDGDEVDDYLIHDKSYNVSFELTILEEFEGYSGANSLVESVRKVKIVK